MLKRLAHGENRQKLKIIMANLNFLTSVVGCKPSFIKATWLMIEVARNWKPYLTLPLFLVGHDVGYYGPVLHSSLLVAISAHLFMFIPAYRETFPSHPHLFLPRPRLPFTMPSVIIRCRLPCLLTCP